MPLKLQAHVDSRIWSLQSTVSFFFYRLYGTAKYYSRLNLVCSGCIFFQNVRKMHFFPMFRNGVKWHKCHIPSNTIRCPAFPYVHIFGLLRIPFLCCGPSLVSASMALTKKKTKKKQQQQQQNKTTPPPLKK